MRRRGRRRRQAYEIEERKNVLRMRLASCAGLMVLVLACGVGPARAESRGEQASKISRSVRQLFRAASLNSMVFGVWVDGRPLITDALGSALPGAPATRQMHFWIGNAMEAFPD